MISLLKVVIRGHEVLKHHQLQSKRTIFSSWPMEGLIIYAKPGVPYYLCKALISRALAIRGKASLKSTTYSFLKYIAKKHCGLLLSEIFAKFWLMWSTEHEEKWIIQVANTNEVRSLFT